MSPRLAPDPLTLLPPPRASARVSAVATLLDCDGALESFTIGKRGVRIYLDSVAAYQERQARAQTSPAKQPGKIVTAARRKASTAAHASAMAELRALGILL